MMNMMKKIILIFICLLFSFYDYSFSGDIVGKIQIKSKIGKVKHGKKKKNIALYNADDFLSKKKSNEGSIGKINEVQQVVIYIEYLENKYSPSANNPTMKQINRTFIPHVLPIIVGQEVDFPNYDSIYHDVYSESAVKKFELPAYANGASKSLKFNKIGVAELFCGIHTNMNAYIVVLQNPFFAMPDKNYTYKISNVPAGKYVLKAWHPRLNLKTQTITVPEKGTLKVDFVL